MMIIDSFADADRFLMNRWFQPAVDRARHRWGLSHIAIAECLYLGAILSYVSAMFSAGVGKPLAMRALLTAVALGWSATFLFLARGHLRVARRYAERPDLVNPLRYRLFFDRIVDIGLMVFFAAQLLFMGWTFIGFEGYAALYALGLYFISCQPGPPKQRRVHTPARAWRRATTPGTA
jgi:hypothetical protein